ncbi:hypothetical protein V5O48_013818 [Marasmius crinis-equi]|uniref:Uncharacterized protein n=1 Tax=Marasmius crinis-equi TaxID=585013 RepID=A0ABR3EZF0_9AGAR
MKFLTSTTVLALFATSATAQQAFIGSPLDGVQVSPGQSLTVRVDRPVSRLYNDSYDTLLDGTLTFLRQNFQSSAQEVAIVLGFKPCGSSGCLTPDNGIGSALYSGSYNPQYDTPSNSLPPHQNFDVMIPDWASKGPAMLSLVHYSLIGAGLTPWMETKSISLNVV